MGRAGAILIGLGYAAGVIRFPIGAAVVLIRGGGLVHRAAAGCWLGCRWAVMGRLYPIWWGVGLLSVPICCPGGVVVVVDPGGGRLLSTGTVAAPQFHPAQFQAQRFQLAPFHGGRFHLDIVAKRQGGPCGLSCLCSAVWG